MTSVKNENEQVALRAGAILALHEAELAIHALSKLSPEDAAIICATFVEEASAGMPPHDPWGDVRADASFWADCANIVEVEVYFAAALRRLGQTALGIGARKRLLVSIWETLSGDDRLSFLARVDPEGNFLRGGSNDC